MAATLELEFRHALDSPVRREVLRSLNHDARPRAVAEIEAELRAFPPSQLSYHLQVLRQSGAVAPEPNEIGPGRSGPLYASGVFGGRPIRAILRATEQRDRELREAVVAANASPLLTMFRVPRPVRTIRLRSRGKIDSERER